MFSKVTQVKNEVGIYARPATYFVQKANEFHSTVWIEKDERRVNAKSLLGVLSLGIGSGAKITIMAEGSDEQECVMALIELIDTEFGK